MKYLVTILIVLVLGGGGAAIWYTREAKGAADAAATRPTAKVERGDLRISVSATGAVASNNDVDIKCRASGEVNELPYDISDEVAPEAMLITLDTKDQLVSVKQANAQLDYDSARLLEAKLAWDVAKLNLVTTRQRAEATLTSTEAKAADARAKKDRTEQLFNQKLASQEDLETAQTAAAQSAADVLTTRVSIAELDQLKLQADSKEQDIKLVEAQMKQDQAKKDLADQSLNYCVVTAPKINEPGTPKWTVAGLTVKIGTLVQSGTSSVSGGAVVMTLSDLSHIYVMATVDESDIGHVQEGQDVRITADSYKGVQFKGKVIRIATKGVNTTNVVTFEVKVEVTSKNRLLLKPMMTANVEIVSSEKKDVVLVPMQAVSRKHADATDDSEAAASAGASTGASTAAATTKAVAAQDDGAPGRAGPGRSDGPKYRPVAFPGTAQVLKSDGKTETREVRLGISDGANYEVISGLEPGDTVVLNKASSDSKFAGGGGRRGGG